MFLFKYFFAFILVKNLITMTTESHLEFIIRVLCYQPGDHIFILGLFDVSTYFLKIKYLQKMKLTMTERLK